MLQKDAARQLFVRAKKCASEEEEQQAKSRRYHTILYKQSVNNSTIIKKSIEIKNSWPEARKHDTIPETRSASDLPTCPIDILHDGSRQTLCSHQSQKPIVTRVRKHMILEIPANRTSFGDSYRKCWRAPGSAFRPCARASWRGARLPRSV